MAGGFRRYTLPSPRSSQPRAPQGFTPYQSYQIQHQAERDAANRLRLEEESGFKREREARDAQTFQDKQDDRELQYRGAYDAAPTEILNEMRKGPSVPRYREETLPVPKGAGITYNGQFTPQPKGSRKAQVFDGMGYSEPVEQFRENASTLARRKAGLVTPADEARYAVQGDRQGFQESKYAQDKLWKYHQMLGQQLRQVSDPTKPTFDDVAAKAIQQKMKSVEQRLGMNFDPPAPPPPPQNTRDENPYADEYPDAFNENGVWKVERDGQKYRIEE